MYKPGNLSAPPAVVTPHQPRLDWQMWFAALGTHTQAPWFTSLIYRLLQGKRDGMWHFCTLWVLQTFKRCCTPHSYYLLQLSNQSEYIVSVLFRLTCVFSICKDQEDMCLVCLYGQRFISELVLKYGGDDFLWRNAFFIYKNTHGYVVRASVIAVKATCRIWKLVSSAP